MAHFSKQDESYMQRALELAARGRGKVSPNPMVGAVLVNNGKILAEAWHEHFGGPHAERKLFEKVQTRRELIRGATLFVTLEPCVSYAGKKTPACILAVLEAKLGRVVIASRDPNPTVSGRGVAALEKSSVKVEVGCLKKQAELLNEKFFFWMREKKPFVGLKIAMSLDGKIATRAGESRWITGEPARAWVYDLRNEYDAILVGIGTVLKDNPRLAGSQREPRRIILDSRLRTPLNAQVLRDTNVLVVTTSAAPDARRKIFEKRGIPLKVFPRKIKPAPLLRFLIKNGISSLMVEGGSEVFATFFESKCVNRAYWFIAPKIIGGNQAKPALGGKGIRSLKDALILKKPKVSWVGQDMLIEGRF